METAAWITQKGKRKEERLRGGSRIVLTSPHIIIPDSKAINSVRTSTGQPDRTELNTALAEVPGGSSTTIKATPGELTSGMNLNSF